MTATTTLTLVDGVRVVVPDPLELITPEQNDWFEDELRFIRTLLKPGECLDAHSAFFARDTTFERLEIIAALGFGGDEMPRRLSLVQQRARASVAHIS